MVDYLKLIDQAWERTIVIAEGLDATSAQLRVLRHLAQREFVAGSGYRLHHFWVTVKDAHDNVALCFYETVNGEKLVNSAHVRVLINPYGVLTTIDMRSGHFTKYDPLDVVQGRPDWKIDKAFLKPFLTNGIQSFSNRHEYWCYIADKDITVRPFFPTAKVLMQCKVAGLERTGICKIGTNTVAVFALWHTDTVSNQELFILYHLNFWNKLKLKIAAIDNCFKLVLKNIVRVVGIKNVQMVEKTPTLKISRAKKDTIGYTYF